MKICLLKRTAFIAALICAFGKEGAAQGDDYFRAAEWNRAAEAFRLELAQKPDSLPLRRKLAYAYRALQDYPRADSLYQIVTADTLTATPDDYLNYGHTLRALKKYQEAKRFYNLYLVKKKGTNLLSDPEVSVALKSCDFALERAGRETNYRFGLVSKLSTDKNDYAPVIYGEQLIFVSREASLGGKKNALPLSPRLGQPLARYYTVDFVNNQIASRTRLFDPAFSETVDYGPGVFSADGNEFFFTRGYKVYGAGDKEPTTRLKIYYTKKNTAGVWTKPQSLAINDDDYSCGHPALSADGATLYFASDKKGKARNSFDSEPDFNLYYCTRKKNGKNWSKPVSLDDLNTPGNEAFPYLDSTQTLYFASDFHKGFGGYDLFKKRKDGGIENLEDFNSSQDDIQILFLNKGLTDGFLTSNRTGGAKGFDVYRFKLTNKPQKVSESTVETTETPTETTTETTTVTTTETTPDSIPNAPALIPITPLPNAPEKKEDAPCLLRLEIPCLRDTSIQLADGRWVTIGPRPANKPCPDADSNADKTLADSSETRMLVPKDAYLFKGVIVEKTISRERAKWKQTNWQRPPAGLAVRLQKNGETLTSGVVEADGTFTLKPLAEGAYQLLVYEGDFELKRTDVTVKRAAPSVRIELEKIVFPVFFELDKADVLPPYEAQLAQTAEWLKKRPALRAQLLGHACPLGNINHNQRLSERRSNAVKIALTKEGIAEKDPQGRPRIQTSNFGESTPFYTDPRYYPKDRCCEVVVRADDNKELEALAEELLQKLKLKEK